VVRECVRELSEAGMPGMGAAAALSWDGSVSRVVSYRDHKGREEHLFG